MSNEAASPPALSKEDEGQLDLLGVLYWVYGGIIGMGGAMFGLFAILPAIFMGAAAPPARGGGPPPWVIGGVFALVFGFVALILIVKGVVMIVVGSALRARKSYVLCMIGAALAVMNIPLGTALAIFTFILLNKPEAKRRFGYALRGRAGLRPQGSSGKSVAAMDPMLREYSTTRCHTKGHPDFVAYAPNLPVPGIVERLIAHLESQVEAGVVYRPGEGIKYGWSVFRLSPMEDGRLVLSEPDMKVPMGHVRTVGDALMQAWRMKEVVASVGLMSRLTFPDIAQRAVVCDKVLSTNEFLLSRLPPKGKSSGWFVGCLDDKHDHERDGALASVPIYELACQIPPLLQFLALPDGVSVAIIGPGRIRTKVFVDAMPREPAPGSYLAALNGV